MKARILLLFLVTVIISGAIGQSTIDLTYTAVDNAAYVQLDSIRIMNRTQGGDTILYYPDTMLSIYYVGIPDISKGDNAFRVFQNYPNPVADQTTVSLYVPEKDQVSIIVNDILGRVIIETERVLDKGKHSFRFTPGSGNLYFFTAQWQGRISSSKMINMSSGSNPCFLEYLGGEPSENMLKATADVQEFFFSPGDLLLYIGYADTLQSGILNAPEESQTYTFQFATNIPCPGTPTVEYEGQVYNTIQVFSQCWLKENLKVGEMIPAEQNMEDNDMIEKFCYNNEPDSCTKYGGLYQWDEMMQYTTQPRSQGICPEGWHLPDDEEWKMLEGATDSHYRIGDPEWDDYDLRGYDVGDHLKAVNGWIYIGGGTDQYGFSALPGGMYTYTMWFSDILFAAHWWTSTEYGDFPWVHSLLQSYGKVKRFSGYYKRFGISVRCIRDEIIIPTIELTFTAVNNTSYVQLDSIKVMNISQGEETLIYWPDTTLVVPGGLAFSPGDQLLYIGYADTLQSGMLDSPEESQTFTFQFATNIPCPGTPTVEYEGQVYNTIQIFSQCWLKENLNVGVMIPGTMEQSNNGTIEKYCYNDEPDSCAKYGGLYQWNEMMQYTIQQGVQGICPPGWHLPTDEEWKVLEGAVDSQYGIGDLLWDYDGDFRGYDAGMNLKTISGWYGNGNGTDLFGFSGLPGGRRPTGGDFDFVGVAGIWWTSTRWTQYPWSRVLDAGYPGVFRIDVSGFCDVDNGFSVRCLRDEIFIPTIELTFTAVNNASYIQLDSIKIMNLHLSAETMIYWSDTTLVVPGELVFTPGDGLLYIGYANGLQSGILDYPEESTPYTFQFATNIPCPGTPTVEYEGQVYNTIQVFSQCWLKENLNVGEMIYGTMEQSSNGTIAKYCYNNEPDSCAKYGGLYQLWMMWGVEEDICPPGWHIPSDEEWTVLEGAVDSQFGIGDPEWHNNGYRGLDAGTNLKTTSGWANNGNGTDLFGFSGLPGGFRYNNGNFGDVGYGGYWWTSTAHDWDLVVYRNLIYGDPGVYLDLSYNPKAFSVRCLRDD
jgi:uncharacterized protein (TIGR02145 family)